MTGRMTSVRSIALHQPPNPAGTFRQPASKFDDSGFEVKMFIATLPRMTALRDLRLSSSDVFQGASADVCAPFARAIPPRVRYLMLTECTVDEDGLRALVVESNVATRRVIVVESLPWMWDAARTEEEDAMAACAMVQARHTAGKSGIVDVFVGARAKRYWL
ncbi:hypothetical protein GGF32_008397 [Allomyces javanicus]|nr:hypothetical protein GGF32_008397 [Allomyces javanicus]